MQREKTYLRRRCQSDVADEQATGFFAGTGTGPIAAQGEHCAALETNAVVHVICVWVVFGQGYDRTGNVVRGTINRVAVSITGDLYELFPAAVSLPRRRLDIR